jgi:hypothetical protein
VQQRDRAVPIHQVQYEDLTMNTENCLREIRSFIGIPYSERMASLAGADYSAMYQGEHHALVKSSRIVPSRHRVEILPPRVKRKTERYVQLWRAGSWNSAKRYSYRH